MLTIRGSTQAWGHTQHTLTLTQFTVHTVDHSWQSGTEQRREEQRREEQRSEEKRRKEKKTELTAIEQDRRQHNRTELKNRTETGATERGIILLSAHVSQDSSSFRGQIREYKLNAMRFECNRQTFPGRSGSLVTFLGRGGFNWQFLGRSGFI